MKIAIGRIEIKHGRSLTAEAGREELVIKACPIDSCAGTSRERAGKVHGAVHRDAVEEHEVLVRVTAAHDKVRKSHPARLNARNCQKL